MKQQESILDLSIIDAVEADYLYVETSQIPHAGQGLYTAIDIYKDEIIAVYLGEKIDDKEAALRVIKKQDQYFINLLDGTILDSNPIFCFAKYANDAFGSSLKNNAKISLNEQQEVCLIATKKIKTGEEIFCSYGKKYWEKHALV
jgi:SET domain-containing protein